MPRPLLIAIAGASGAGKTALARGVATALDPSSVAVIPMDAYYRDRPALSSRERVTVNYDAPDAIDSALLGEHLRAMISGRPIDSPCYDYRTHARTADTRVIEPGRYIVVEGLLALYWPAMRALFKTAVFIDIDEPTALARRLARDTHARGRTVASVRDQWTATVWPMARRYVTPTKRFADVTVAGTDPLDESVAAVLDHVRAAERGRERR